MTFAFFAVTVGVGEARGVHLVLVHTCADPVVNGLGSSLYLWAYLLKTEHSSTLKLALFSLCVYPLVPSCHPDV